MCQHNLVVFNRKKKIILLESEQALDEKKNQSFLSDKIIILNVDIKVEPVVRK